MKLAASFLVVAALVAPTPASAGWQAQQLPDTPAYGATLAFNGRGGGAALWERRLGEPRFLHRHHDAFISALAPGGRFGPARLVGHGLLPSGLSLPLQGPALVLATQHLRHANRIETLVGTPSRGFHRSQVLDSSRLPYRAPPLLASDGRGDAILFWSRATLRHRGRPAMFSVRVRGGRFSRPRTVAEPGASGLAAAMNANGQYVLAWDRGERLEVRTGRGAHLGPVTTVAHDSLSLQLKPAIDDAGDAIVAWVGGTTRLDMAFSYRSAGGAFGPPEHGVNGSLPVGDPVAAFAGRGKALLAWSGTDSSGSGVFSVEVDDGAPLPPVGVSPPSPATTIFSGPELKTISSAPDGRVVFLWTSESTHEHSVTDGTLVARQRGANGTLGDVEPVATVNGYAAEATVGLEPLGGTAIALMTEHRIPGASPFRAFFRR